MARNDIVSHALMDRSLYEIPEAARLINVPASTLRWWLQGKSYRGSVHLPVLREEQNSIAVVTWGEFIEAAVLRFLRRGRDKRISMKELRLFRLEVQSRHPEDHYPLAGDLHINAGRLGRSHAAGVWEPSTGTMWDEASAVEFLERCKWQEHVPISFQPLEEYPDVQVAVQQQFGAPLIAGVRTQSLFDLVAAGGSHEEVSYAFGITNNQVEEAVSFELKMRGLQDVA